MTPNDLARELGVDPKRLRGWLRSTWPPLHPHSRWDLSPEQIAAARLRFLGSASAPYATASEAETLAAPEKPIHIASSSAAQVPGDLLDDESWSPWVPMLDALSSAPQLPGVYMARQGGTGADIIYVGMAGERRGQGVRGRLAIYGSGKGLASGLGEAVFDRALADIGWLEARLAEVRAGHPRRAKEWGRAAFQWAQLELRWRTTADRAAALALELAVLRALPNAPLWNRLK